MTTEKILELAETYQAKADKAMDNFQETGLTRYRTERERSEDLAEALRQAALSNDEHHVYIALRADVSRLASMAEKALQDNDGMEGCLQELVAMARLYKLC